MIYRTYLFLFVIFSITLVLGFIATDESTKYLLAGTSGLSIISLCIKFLIEQIKSAIAFAYDKQKLSYEISVNSNLAYDIHKKYIQFCEEYIAAVYTISEKLFREGNSEKTLDYSFELYNIRKNSSLYIPEDVHEELEKFEYTLRVLGAEAGFQKDTIDSEIDDELRRQSVKKTYKLFSQLMDKNNSYKDRKIKNREEIVRYIRETVGVSRMVELKNDILSNKTGKSSTKSLNG